MARKQGSHADITGPRIRDAALTLFAQHGYAAVSMRQIARHVGVQAGAIYNYVPDKQTLLFDLLTRHMHELLAARADRCSGSAIVMLKDFVNFHIDFHLKRPDQVFISYMELRNLNDANFKAVDLLRQSYERELSDILRLGVQSDEFQVTEPKVTSFAIIAMLTGGVNWFRDTGRLSEKDTKAHYWTLVQRMVVCDAN